VETREAERALRYQRLFAAAEARRQEAGGIALASVILPAAEFTHVVSRADRDNLLLQYRLGELRNLAFDSFPTQEMFDESCPPLALKPAR
jgi:hypothetical protein